MTRRRLLASALLGALGGLGLPAAARGAPARPLRVAAVFQTPVEEPWVGVIHAALRRAGRELGVRYEWTPAVAAADFERVLTERAAKTYALLVGDAFGQEEAARRVARAHPRLPFLFGSGLGPAPPNFGVFDDWLHEPAYLCGLIAGKLTRSNVVGVVGAQPVAEINRLVNAFAAGARETNPGVRVKVAFIGGWYDPPKAREAALAQIAAGADLLYAERAGVIEAARERGVLAFGNLVDQHALGPDTVVTGPVWDAYPLIRLVVRSVRAATFAPLDYAQWTMMQQGGAALAPLLGWETRLPRDLVDLVRGREQAIRAGLFRVAIEERSPASD